MSSLLFLYIIMPSTGNIFALCLVLIAVGFASGSKRRGLSSSCERNRWVRKVGLEVG